MNSVNSIFVLVCFIICSFMVAGCDKDENNTPDNTGKIAFDTNRDLDDNQGAEIYVTNEDGSKQTRLTSSPGFDTDPKWNSTGTKIIFTSHRGDTTTNIYVMNADGSQQTLLTDPLFGGNSPVYSPDNSKIAYNSSDGNSSSNAGIYLMNANGSNRIRLGSAFGDSDPEFSPDGSKIVFTSSRTGDNEIYVMNADGTNQVRLTDEIYSDFMPSWSPDGNKIVFISFRGNAKAIYTMNADGSNQIPLIVSESPDQPNDPTYNREGNKIVYSSNNRLHIINADGTQNVSLPGSGFNSNPDWL